MSIPKHSYMRWNQSEETTKPTLIFFCAAGVQEQGFSDKNHALNSTPGTADLQKVSSINDHQCIGSTREHKISHIANQEPTRALQDDPINVWQRSCVVSRENLVTALNWFTYKRVVGKHECMQKHSTCVHIKRTAYFVKLGTKVINLPKWNMELDLFHLHHGN